MRNFFLILKREYLVKIKNKSFILMTFLSPLIFLALFSLVAYLSKLNNSEVKTIAVLDESSQFFNEFENDIYTNYQILENVTLADAKKMIQDGNSYGLLYIPDVAPDNFADKIQFFSKESPSMSVVNGFTKKIEKRIFDANLKKLGVDASMIEASKVYVNISFEDFSGEKSSERGNLLKLIFGGAAGYLLMMFIIIYGNMIMRSVIEEKTSRIVEIIISSVKPIQLMLGKIVGTSLAGITQFLIWTFVGMILMIVASMIFGIDLAVMKSPPNEMLVQAASNDKAEEAITSLMVELFKLPLTELIISFIIYFLGGYLLYSSMYATI